MEENKAGVHISALFLRYFLWYHPYIHIDVTVYKEIHILHGQLYDLKEIQSQKQGGHPALKPRLSINTQTGLHSFEQLSASFPCKTCRTEHSVGSSPCQVEDIRIRDKDWTAWRERRKRELWGRLTDRRRRWNLTWQMTTTSIVLLHRWRRWAYSYVTFQVMGE